MIRGQKFKAQTTRAKSAQTIREEGVVKTKRNYVLYQSGIRKIKEPEPPKIEPPKVKAKPAPPKPKPQPKPEYVKRTEVIDNYEYKQTENNKKLDPKRKSITIHQRLSEPVVREIYEAKTTTTKMATKPTPKPVARPTPKPAPRPAPKSKFSSANDSGDNYQYHESKIVRKEKHMSEVFHQRRSDKKF